MASAHSHPHHDHVHDHGHTHPHHHGPAVALEALVRAQAAEVAPSLLRLSWGLRVALAGGLIAAIWLGVFWAVR